MADKVSERTVTIEVSLVDLAEHMPKVIDTLFTHACRQGEYIDSITYKADTKEAKATITAKIIDAKYGITT
jgi:hypothetical protein